jgi:hypothetical protein
MMLMMPATTDDDDDDDDDVDDDACTVIGQVEPLQGQDLEAMKRGVGQDYFFNYTDILNYQTAKVIDVVDGMFR